MTTLAKSPVVFHEKDHIYELNGVILKGITSTLVKRAYPDTYKDVPEEVLAKAAEKGKIMHQLIELWDDVGIESELTELRSYKKVIHENHLDVLATEYIVSDEEYYATAIDKVMLDENGEVILVDLKHTSTIHYENVALQLSICKRFFEMQNPNIKVKGIYVLWLRDDKYRFERLNVVSDEFIDELIAVDMANSLFDVKAMYGNLPEVFADAERRIAEYEVAAKNAKSEQDMIRAGLLELMEKHNIKCWDGEYIKITRTPQGERVAIDSKRLKEEMPEVYDQYTKKTITKPSLRITLK